MKYYFLKYLGVGLFIFIVHGTLKAQVINVDMNDADIIDLGFPDNQRPKSPNAGTKVFDARKPLDATFSFNRKIEFRIIGEGKTFNSWFYLNLEEGYSMMDRPALQQMPMGAGGSDIDMVQIVDPDYVMYNYINSPEGKFAMKMGDESMAILTDLKSEVMANEFFDNFKKTGKILQAGAENIQFKRVEYKGEIDGIPTTVWLSDARDVLIDVTKIRTLTGHMGIGYIATAKGKTYLVSGVEREGVKVLVTRISKENKSFSGAGYRGIGDMVAIPEREATMAEARATMQKEIDDEDDPYIKQLMLENMSLSEEMMEKVLDSRENFGKTSNLDELSSGSYEDEYYSIMLSNLKVEYRELELSLQKNPDSESYQRIKCEMGCNLIQQNRVERMWSGTKDIRNQYKNDSEKADELVGSYVDGIMTEMMTNPCICGN